MNFNALDLNLLRVFDALMRERSVTRAGEQIGLSQPAVSAALNRLRALMGDQLFVRRGNEMVPTPRADDLFPPVRDALQSIEAALAPPRGFEPATARRTFTLLGADFFSVLLMPRLFARWCDAAPGITWRFLDSARGDVQRLLQEDAIDAALERPLETQEPIESRILFSAPFVVIARQGHPALADLEPGAPIPMEIYTRLPHAIRSIDGTLSGMVDEALAAAGHRRLVRIALPHFHGVAEAVASTSALAAVPRQFAEAIAARLDLSIHAVPAEIPAPEVRLYWHGRRTGDPAHRWLRDAVLAVSAELWG
ncbi:LysR family transcriptional regulator [Chthonobacter rhizosphaerae]|uniref:LysR family transcriptional regulator n=1 Tax=Chthonobacter rhizosphaerae TaxID=2735553 RepID=UPI0015EF7B88|nr:LysR family transcriptional regulator [Chthonobacter rhizosphaerae]